MFQHFNLQFLHIFFGRRNETPLYLFRFSRMWHNFLWRREILNSRSPQWWRLRSVLFPKTVTANGITPEHRSTTTHPGELDLTRTRSCPIDNKQPTCSRTWDSDSMCIFCRKRRLVSRLANSSWLAKFRWSRSRFDWNYGSRFLLFVCLV